MLGLYKHEGPLIGVNPEHRVGVGAAVGQVEEHGPHSAGSAQCFPCTWGYHAGTVWLLQKGVVLT